MSPPSLWFKTELSELYWNWCVSARSPEWVELAAKRAFRLAFSLCCKWVGLKQIRHQFLKVTPAGMALSPQLPLWKFCSSSKVKTEGLKIMISNEVIKKKKQVCSELWVLQLHFCEWRSAVTLHTVPLGKYSVDILRTARKGTLKGHPVHDVEEDCAGYYVKAWLSVSLTDWGRVWRMLSWFWP